MYCTVLYRTAILAPTTPTLQPHTSDDPSERLRGRARSLSSVFHPDEHESAAFRTPLHTVLQYHSILASFLLLPTSRTRPPTTTTSTNILPQHQRRRPLLRCQLQLLATYLTRTTPRPCPPRLASPTLPQPEDRGHNASLVRSNASCRILLVTSTIISRTPGRPPLASLSHPSYTVPCPLRNERQNTPHDDTPAHAHAHAPRLRRVPAAHDDRARRLRKRHEEDTRHTAGKDTKCP